MCLYQRDVPSPNARKSCDTIATSKSSRDGYACTVQVQQLAAFAVPRSKQFWDLGLRVAWLAFGQSEVLYKSTSKLELSSPGDPRCDATRGRGQRLPHLTRLHQMYHMYRESHEEHPADLRILEQFLTLPKNEDLPEAESSNKTSLVSALLALLRLLLPLFLGSLSCFGRIRRSHLLLEHCDQLLQISDINFELSTSIKLTDISSSYFSLPGKHDGFICSAPKPLFKTDP